MVLYFIQSQMSLQVSHIFIKNILLKFNKIYKKILESEVNIIKDAMKTIEEKTKLSDKKCIQFKERKNESDYVIIQDGIGCSSMVNIFKIINLFFIYLLTRKTVIFDLKKINKKLNKEEKKLR
jgi:hypothetical protein